jgi:hypothetical protein
MTAPRLPVFRGDGKRDSEAKARRREHAAAFATTTGRITRHVVDAIHKPGMRLLEEIASGAKRGPGEVIEQLVTVARDHKPEHEALAVARVLMNRIGYGIFAVDPSLGFTATGYVGSLADLLRRASMFVQAGSSAVEPGSDGGEEITPAELPGLERLLDELDAAIRDLRPRLQARAHRGCPLPTLVREG